MSNGLYRYAEFSPSTRSDMRACGNMKHLDHLAMGGIISLGWTHHKYQSPMRADSTRWPADMLFEQPLLTTMQQCATDVFRDILKTGTFGRFGYFHTKRTIAA